MPAVKNKNSISWFKSPAKADGYRLAKKEFYVQLNGLRAIAVFAVMFSHWIPSAFIKYLGFGFTGVTLFFVLSGFLITEILLKQILQEEGKNTILKSFYLKRILRIFPIYYLVIFLAYVYNLDGSKDLPVYTLTYTLNFYNVFTGNIGNGLSHLWSLCVEEQFYILWPLLLLMVKPRYHLALIGFIIFTAIGFRIFFYAFHLPNHSLYNYRMMPACLDALGLGALMAYLKIFEVTKLKKILEKNFIPLAAVLLYLVIAFKSGDVQNIISETMSGVVVSVFSFFLIGKAVFGFKKTFGKFLESRLMQFLGKISYGLYLYHLIIKVFFAQRVANLLLRLPLHILPMRMRFNLFVFSAPIYLFLTILVSATSYYVLEKPLLALKDKVHF